jgi:hypothetical protein
MDNGPLIGAARRPTRCRHGGSPSTPLASLALSSAATSASPRSAPSTASPAQRRARRTLPRSICARSAHRGTSQQNARSRWPGVEARACARRLVPEPAPGQRAQVPARPDVARRTWDSPHTARAVANDRSGSGSHGGTARSRRTRCDGSCVRRRMAAETQRRWRIEADGANECDTASAAI